MDFTLDWYRYHAQICCMHISSRKLKSIIAVAAFATAWILLGPLTAGALAFVFVGYQVVLAMDTTAAEIRRIRMEERPDLYWDADTSSRQGSTYWG